MVDIIAVAQLINTGDKQEHIIMLSVSDEHQGQGYGNSLLELLTAKADAQEATLTLNVVVPTGAPPKTAEELRDWFSAHGFIVTDEGEPFRMVREPVKHDNEKSLANA